MIKIYREIIILIGSLFIFLIAAIGCTHDGESIKIIEKPIKSYGDIVTIDDSLVVPYVYTSAVSLKNLPVPEKKKKFFDMMLPAVLVAKKELSFLYAKVNVLSLKATLSTEEQKFIDSLQTKYKAKNIELLKVLGEPQGFFLRQIIHSAFGPLIQMNREYKLQVQEQVQKYI